MRAKSAKASGPARGDAKEAAKAADRDDLDDIVRSIIEDMCAGRWRAGTSHGALMKKHDVALKTVQGWAARAAATLRQCRGDGEEIRSALVAGIEHIRERALESDDLRNALASYELQAKVLGSMAPKEVRVDVTKLTDEQLLEQLKQQGYDVSKRKADE